MHHPTDVIGSVIGATGCLAFAFLATRTGVAVAERNERAAREGAPAEPLDGDRGVAPSPVRPASVEVSP
jgi:hypothetical protein